MERLVPVSYWVALLWALAVLVGLVGLGRLVARWVGQDPAFSEGWGLHATLGMGVYLAAGGVLAVTGLCNEWGITLLIGVGVVVFVATTVRQARSKPCNLAELPWSSWPAWVCVAFLFCGGLVWQLHLGPGDDYPAYFEYCEKLLSTGSFDEPFSWRRLASLGGQTLLQCSILAQTSWINVQAFETALCPVILLGLIFGFRGGVLARRPVGLLIALIAITTRMIRINTASHSTGVVLLLGLFVMLDLISTATGARRLRLWGVAGLLAAATCSLRAQNVPAAFGALGLFWLFTWMRERQALRVSLTQAAWWGGGLLLGLLPWMIMGWRSNGSPLFPLFQGSNNLAFNPLSPVGGLSQRLAPLVSMVLDPVLLPLLLCLLAIPAWKNALPAHAMAISAVFASLALAYAAAFAPDVITIPRYVQPLLLAAALAALMTAGISIRTRFAAIALGILLVITTWEDRLTYLANDYSCLANTDRLAIPLQPQTVMDYRTAQALVPEGQKILVCTDFPFVFDFQRNPISIIDFPHACSPGTKMPYQRPAEETKRYLRELGWDYVIFVDAAQSHSLYLRSNWEGFAKGNIALWKIQAPFFLDFFDTTERLAQTESVLGKVGNLTVLHLRP